MRIGGSIPIWVLVLGFYSNAATGQVSIYLADRAGSPKSVEISAGETFQVDVGLGSLESLLGLSYWVKVSDNGSGKFILKARDVSVGCPFTDLMTENAELLLATDAILDPFHERDLGGFVPGMDVPVPAGVYPLAVLTFSASPDLLPGTYVLSFQRAIAVNAAFDTLTITPDTYTVTVTDGSRNGGAVGDDGSSEGTGENLGSGDDAGGSIDGDANGNNDSGGADNNGGTADDPPAEMESDAETGKGKVAGCGAGVGTATILGAMLYLWLMRPLPQQN